MAGLGAKLFASFTKLTAADVNGYLADQAIMRFATSTARDAAFGGAGEPTLAEGMTCYLDDTNVLQSYTGSAWVEIASSDGKAPRGVMGYTTSTTATVNLTTSFVTQITVTFTAVANRYYRFTYYEPQILTSNASAQYVQSVVRSSLSGTPILQQAFLGQTAAVSKFNELACVGVSTFTAGSVTLSAQALSSSTSGTPGLNRGGTQPAYLLVEDIGAV